MDGFGGVFGSGRMMDTIKRVGGIPDVALLLLGEFQSVAEDLESRLFITESTCLGRLTVDREHLPKEAKRAPHRCSHRSHGWEAESELVWRHALRSNDASTNIHPHAVKATTVMHL